MTHPSLPPRRLRRLGRALATASLLSGVVAGLVASPLCLPARADDKPAPAPAPAPAPSGSARAAELGIAAKANQVRGDEITPEATQAIDKGLKWLADHQGRDGSYSQNASAAGITALAGLAFMEQGNLPGRGKYGANVQKCLDFVLKSCNESGLICADQTSGPMYGHGFATLFLGEIYGMTGDETVREKLTMAVRLIQNTQNKDGGWRYQPMPYDADISVTICEIMGLRAARDAGIKVEKQTIDHAIDYVRHCQNPDGGFSYVKGQGTGSGFARSAAGVASLYYAGVFEGEDLKKGLNYLKQFSPGGGGGGAMQTAEMEGHFYYGNYYAVQAMFLAGGDYWAKWYPGIRDTLIRRQKTGPGNDHWSGDVSDDYATATALIILQMPNRYLPVFNGKGPGD